MSDNEQAALRTHLSQLNERSRWYVARLWHVSFAFIAVTAIPLAQLTDKGKQDWLPLGLCIAGIVGILTFVHLVGVWLDARRAVKYLRETEGTLLGQTDDEKLARWTWLDHLPLFVMVGGLTVLYLCAACRLFS